jgi:hypothetical protein
LKPIEWLSQNYQWFLSGLGLSIFSVAIGFLGYWYKARSESKKKNKLNLSESITKFDLPRNDTFGHEAISVSYNSKSYENLVHYYATAENIGLTSIQNQNIFIELPDDFSVVSSKTTTSSKAIGLSANSSVDGSELSYVIDRLEPGEYVSISILGDTCSPEHIKTKPRGVENVEYSSDKKLSSGAPDDIQVALMLLGAFIATGSVPFIGTVLQAVLIMVGSPFISRVIRSMVGNKRQIEGVVSTSAAGTLLDREEQVELSSSEVKVQFVKY